MKSLHKILPLIVMGWLLGMASISAQAIIDSFSNLGIGKEDPRERLDVLGHILLGNGTDFPGDKQGYLFMRSYDDPALGFPLIGGESQSAGTILNIGGSPGSSVSARYIDFYTGDNESQARVTEKGYLGLGTKNPVLRLQVNGHAGKPGGGEWLALSDRRLKDNVWNFEAGLEEVMQIRPVFYTYNGMLGNSRDQVHVGLIAQEFQKIAPYSVLPVETEIGETLMVDGSAIKYMLVMAFQELFTLFEEDKAQLELLKQEVKELHERVARLEKGSRPSSAANKHVGVHEQTVVLASPDRPRLDQNHPNPTTGETTITYYLPQQAKDAFLRVYTVQEHVLQTIPLPNTGEGRLNMDASALPPGIYFYELRVDGELIGTRKMVVGQ